MERLRASLAEHADPPGRVLVAIAHADMRLARSPREALRLLERVLAREPYPPRPNASASIIVTLLGLEAFGLLQRLCDDMLRDARRRSAVQELMGVASFSAWALYRRGELADAEAQARWAVEHATGIWAIDALAHLVETLTERGALDDAATELRRMAPPLTSITGRDALTASELRVARLAAAGRTNREIAQELFITTKTASAHLSRAYRKLAVTRRGQLAEALVSKTPAVSRHEAARTA